MPRVIIMCLILLMACGARADICTIPAKPKAPQGPTVTVEKDQVRMTVSLAKAAYQFREPIIVTITLLNLSDKPIRIAEPTEGGTIHISVIQTAGARPTAPLPTIIRDYFALPANYGWDFKPGDEKRYDFLVYLRYPYTAPVGEFELSVAYQIPRDVKHTWRAVLAIGAIGFKVTDVPDQVKARGQAFWALTSGFASKEDRVAALAYLPQLADPATGGVYTDYAGYAKAKSLAWPDESEGYCRALREYVAEHPNIPYYSELARHELADCLYREKRYDEAILALQDCQEGYYQSAALRSYEMEKQRQKR